MIFFLQVNLFSERIQKISYPSNTNCNISTKIGLEYLSNLEEFSINNSNTNNVFKKHVEEGVEYEFLNIDGTQPATSKQQDAFLYHIPQDRVGKIQCKCYKILAI